MYLRKHDLQHLAPLLSQIQFEQKSKNTQKYQLLISKLPQAIIDGLCKNRESERVSKIYLKKRTEK